MTAQELVKNKAKFVVDGVEYRVVRVVDSENVRASKGKGRPKTFKVQTVNLNLVQPELPMVEPVVAEPVAVEPEAVTVASGEFVGE